MQPSLTPQSSLSPSLPPPHSSRLMPSTCIVLPYAIARLRPHMRVGSDLLVLSAIFASTGAIPHLACVCVTRKQARAHTDATHIRLGYDTDMT